MDLSTDRYPCGSGASRQRSGRARLPALGPRANHGARPAGTSSRPITTLIKPGRAGPLWIAVEMAVQFLRPGRSRDGCGIEVHDCHDPHARLGSQGTCIVRVPAPVEEDQVTCVRSYDRAVPVGRFNIGRIRVMGEDEFPPCARDVIRAEQETSQRIRVSMEFESHHRTALNIQYDAVPVVLRGHDWFSAYGPGELKKISPVSLV